MSWQEFTQHSPELAEIVRERLERKITYLATIWKDGSPRLHPAIPFIGEGRLFIFTEPSSPKIGDLRRDGRYAQHCPVGAAGEPLLEVMVSGRVKTLLALKSGLVQSSSPVLRRPLNPISCSSFSYSVFSWLNNILNKNPSPGIRPEMPEANSR